MATAVKTRKTTEVATLVTAEELVEKFRYINSKVPNLEKTSLALKVESAEQLVIAENNASEVAAFIKEVDNTRKLLKAPYAATALMIDSYSGAIKDALERAKIRFVTVITNYKTIQEAAAKADRNARQKELDAIEAEKKAEGEKIKRIEQQLLARIYGGTYLKKDGAMTSANGCISPKDCNELAKWIDVNAPKIDSFVHFSVMYEEMMLGISKKLTEQKLALIDLEAAEGPIAKKGALTRIAEARGEAMVGAVRNAELTEMRILRDTRREEKQMDLTVHKAGLGVRETVKYVVQDEALVPRDMLCVDVKKLSEYLNANKDRIKDCIAKNEEILPGIKFYIDNSFIVR